MALCGFTSHILVRMQGVNVPPFHCLRVERKFDFPLEWTVFWPPPNSFPNRPLGAVTPGRGFGTTQHRRYMKVVMLYTKTQVQPWSTHGIFKHLLSHSLLFFTWCYDWVLLLQRCLNITAYNSKIEIEQTILMKTHTLGNSTLIILWISRTLE